jgi:UDP-N-acetyl-D-mannosaminuronic acid dehydrogenase
MSSIHHIDGMHQKKKSMVNQLRVIGGIYDCCLHEGMQFYNGQLFENKYNGTDIIYTNMAATLEPSLSSSFVASNKSLEIPMHPLPMVEIAEVTKIVENAHRYLQIAFAEELYLYCQENKMSFLEIRDALNSKWNVNILEPREGIGGHCLPKDTKMSWTRLGQ